MAGSWVEGKRSLPTHNALCGTCSLVLCAQHVSADKCFMLSSQNPPSFPNVFSFVLPISANKSPSDQFSKSDFLTPPPNPVRQTKKVPSYLMKKQTAQRTRVVKVGEWKTQLRDPDYSHPPFYNIIPEKKKNHIIEQKKRSGLKTRCRSIAVTISVWISLSGFKVTNTKKSDMKKISYKNKCLIF